MPQRNGSESLLFFSVAAQERVPSREIEELIVELSSGNTEALERLYVKTKSAVYGFALSILKNTHQAEDVLQDTYLKILASADSYTPKGKPMAWIMTVTKNLALMKIRENSRFADCFDCDISRSWRDLFLKISGNSTWIPAYDEQKR